LIEGNSVVNGEIPLTLRNVGEDSSLGSNPPSSSSSTPDATSASRSTNQAVISSLTNLASSDNFADALVASNNVSRCRKHLHFNGGNNRLANPILLQYLNACLDNVGAILIRTSYRFYVNNSCENYCVAYSRTITPYLRASTLVKAAPISIPTENAVSSSLRSSGIKVNLVQIAVSPEAAHVASPPSSSDALLPITVFIVPTLVAPAIAGSPAHPTPLTVSYASVASKSLPSNRIGAHENSENIEPIRFRVQHVTAPVRNNASPAPRKFLVDPTMKKVAIIDVSTGGTSLRRYFPKLNVSNI
jgi:hypothetical protein